MRAEHTISPNKNTLCWINGQQCPPEQATLSIFDHGILYGDGAFEGIRFYHHQPFQLDEHIIRLFESAKSIELEIPYSASQLIETVNNLCQSAHFSHGYIRLVITRGAGDIGLNPVGCGPASVFIILTELNMMPASAADDGITTIIANTRRVSSSAIDPCIKSLNYLNNILAKQEANRANVDEAILLNDQNQVAEAVAENIFIVKAGELFTPPCNDGALNGITRKTIQFLAKENHIASHMKSISESDLFDADEVFLTGTGAELIPVKSINGKSIKQCPGPVFKRLKGLFSELIEQQTNPRTYTA